MISAGVLHRLPSERATEPFALLRVLPRRRFNVTPKTTEQNLLVRICKSEAEATNNNRLCLRYCAVEANYWQTRSIARPLCDNGASSIQQQMVMPKRISDDSESSHDWCSVVNKLVRSKYVDKSKRQLCLYQSTVTPTRTEHNLFGVSIHTAGRIHSIGESMHTAGFGMTFYLLI